MAVAIHSVAVYKMSGAGVALEAMLAGTKYWPDAKFNDRRFARSIGSSHLPITPRCEIESRTHV